jgi:hypothetical protein
MNLMTNHLPYNAIILVGEGKELVHVIATINVDDQLVAISKNINCRFKPNDPTIFFKRRHNCPSIEM